MLTISIVGKKPLITLIIGKDHVLKLRNIFNAKTVEVFILKSEKL